MKQKILYILLLITTTLSWSLKMEAEVVTRTITIDGTALNNIVNKYFTYTDSEFGIIKFGNGETSIKYNDAATDYIELGNKKTTFNLTFSEGLITNQNYNVNVTKVLVRMSQYGIGGTKPTLKSSSSQTENSVNVNTAGLNRGNDNYYKDIIITGTNLGSEHTLSVDGTTGGYWFNKIEITYTKEEIIHNVTVKNNVDETTYTIQAGVKTTATATAYTKNGYEFDTWVLDNEITLTEQASITSNPISINATADGKTITANYNSVFFFSSFAYTNNTDHGNVNTRLASTKNLETPDVTSSSTTATFTATPNEGYMFKGWRATADATTYESTENPYTVTITNNTPGSTANKTLYAIFEPIENTPKTLTLNSTTIASYEPDTYETVTLERTLKAGYNTLALPLDTDVKTLTGRENEDDWVAQLSLVTENAKDGYTLFFQKVENGQMEANLPYILHLASDVVNPQWTDMEVKTAEPVSTNSIKGWTMSSNYEAGKNMEGLYGIVNATPTETNQGGCLMLGASGSTLAPFMAYIVGPSPANNVKVAYIDDATDIKQVTWMDADEVEGIYTSSGIRVGKEMLSGLNIVRMKSGKVKKLWVK